MSPDLYEWTSFTSRGQKRAESGFKVQCGSQSQSPQTLNCTCMITEMAFQVRHSRPSESKEDPVPSRTGLWRQEILVYVRHPAPPGRDSPRWFSYSPRASVSVHQAEAPALTPNLSFLPSCSCSFHQHLFLPLFKLEWQFSTSFHCLHTHPPPSKAAIFAFLISQFPNLGITLPQVMY